MDHLEEDLNSSNTICGIKIKNIKSFIKILREKYSIVKQGTKYIENSERKYDITALANIRDFLSHIETAFKDGASDKECEENIGQAEEHLRRALVESHQIALESRLETFLEEYSEYEKNMLPDEEKYGLREITNHEELRSNIRKVQDFLSEGRKRKGTNIWNKEWEIGVECFVSGYELAVELQENIKKYKALFFTNKYRYDKERKNRRLVIGLFITSLISAIIISAFYSDSFQVTLQTMYLLKD